MLKKFFFKVTMIATAMTGAMVLSSCGHDDISFDENKVKENSHAQALSDYQKTFVSMFGQPAADQCWDYTLGQNNLLARAPKKKNDKKKGELTQWTTNTYYNYACTTNYTDENGNDPMHEDELNHLFKNHLNTVLAAINSADTPVLNWNPASLGTVVFRSYATFNNTSSGNRYFSVGANIDGNNYYLSQEHVSQNVNTGKRGTTGNQHTTAINLSAVPSTAIWFASSTTSHKEKIDPTQYQLTQYKEVTLELKSKDGPVKSYTFWGFKTESDKFTDLILWVEKSNASVYSKSKRFFVEDLGGSSNSDIDFNDIVFDVVEYLDGSQECIIRALGGTLPITITVCGKSWSKPESIIGSMINTGVDGPISFDKVIDRFAITGWNPNNNNSISVKVTDKDNFSFVSTFPKNGDIPLMVAFATTKEWKAEKVSVDAEWLELEEDDEE